MEAVTIEIDHDVAISEMRAKLLRYANLDHDTDLTLVARDGSGFWRFKGRQAIDCAATALDLARVLEPE